MTSNDLLRVMERWGFHVKTKGFCEYLEKMLAMDRVLVLYDDGTMQAVLFYYLTEDYLKLYKKSAWETATDNPEGHQLYIDKMVCRHWTRGLRSAIQTAFQERFPHITEAYYHRAPFDRCVKIRRGTGELCSKI